MEHTGGGKKTDGELRRLVAELESKNNALKEVIAQVEMDKQALREQVMANVQTVLLPSLERIRSKSAAGEDIDQHRRALEELTSSFGYNISHNLYKLTPREIEICAMVKNGLRNKEIAKLLKIALHTVEKHRRMVRSKLGLANKDINLRTYLNTL
ncbi:MAG: LuxR C-terminal-related transcriptional regulator [Candidatus Omnitrophica bacterium]|nr:LuxR C-terminal-related transcriptional regulator [Candidatus Omnitrophota bacterium]